MTARHSRDTRILRHQLSAERALKRTQWIGDRLAEGRAALWPDYHRWALMYAKRRSNAIQALGRATRIMSRDEAIADLQWLVEHVPAVGLAACWAIPVVELQRWIKTGPPTWRYSSIQTICAQVRGLKYRRGAEVPFLRLTQ